MNILKKSISVVIIINILIILITSISQSVTYATTQKESSNISGISNSDYPGIKSMIQALQKEHPNWTFKVLYTGLDWEDVITGETSTHGTNLVPYTYKSTWICSTCGSKKYDNGTWRCASVGAVAYMMDPRNSLNSDDIFQFLQLSYVDCTYNDLKSMVSNYSYLNNKTLINNIISWGKTYDVNPYYIIARLIQEQGSGTSVLVTGASYTGTDGVKYSGYYNAFNINASGSSTAEIYTNGLAYAKKMGWNSLSKSIKGGIEAIASNYISYGQDTMYFQKFNVSSTKYSYYTHQYMQNVLAAQNEGTTLRKTLDNEDLLDEAYTFVIPLYENMPSTACTVSYTLSSSSSTSSTTYSTGDLNGDGKINSADLLLLQKHLLGTAVITNSKKLTAADINGDDKINSADLLLIKKHLLGTYTIK